MQRTYRSATRVHDGPTNVRGHGASDLDGSSFCVYVCMCRRPRTKICELSVAAAEKNATRAIPNNSSCSPSPLLLFVAIFRVGVIMKN